MNGERLKNTDLINADPNMKKEANANKLYV